MITGGPLTDHPGGLSIGGGFETLGLAGDEAEAVELAAAEAAEPVPNTVRPPLQAGKPRPTKLFTKSALILGNSLRS